VTAPGQAALVEVILNRSYASRRDVIEAIGDAMLASAAITPAYVEGMLRKEEEGATIVTAEVALPHGTHDVKHAVLRSAVVVVPIPEGVEWMPGRRVRLAIGVAGAGDQAHLRLLNGVARALSNEQIVARVKAATTQNDVTDFLAELNA
jgi:mannitol/fructose-specific phosphotransferase system IIA component